MLLPLLAALACDAPRADPAPPPPSPAPPEAPAPDLTAAGLRVGEVFPPPAGAERVPTDAWGASLLELPLRAADAPVLTHDGRPTGHRARVVDLPLVPGDLQQCADSILRVRAEWLRAQGQEVMFHATSGDPIPWSRWQAGERPFVSGPGLAWRPGTRGGWEAYLAAVFTWAGTASLQAHETVAVDAPRGGDLLVQGGFPGHAALLLDVARRGDEVYVLVAEGFMPAQDFHVELGPEGGWWPLTWPLELPVWTFAEGALRRFHGS